MRPDRAAAARKTVLPDALLVYRIAALRDRAALAEVDRRHGMTLYALAYSCLFDAEAADGAVAAAFREVWRGAAAFDPRERSVGRWLAELTRRAVDDRLRGRVGPRPRALPPVSPRRPRRRAAWAQLARVAATLVVPALLLA